MRFAEYKTWWDTEKSRYPTDWNYAKYSRYMIGNLKNDRELPLDLKEMFQYAIAYECAWMDAGRPYYKFEADILSASMNANIDVSSLLFRCPHPVFALRLPDDGPQIEYHCVEHDTVKVRSMLVVDTGDPAIGCEASDGHRSIAAIIQAEELRAPHVWIFHLCDGMTIDESIVWSDQHCDPGESDAQVSLEQERRYLEMQRCLARLIFSACLFATVAMRYLLRDVLAADRDEHEALAADDPCRAFLEDRATRRGVTGRCITTRHLRLARPVDGSRAAQGAPEGRELRYQHIRGAHWHTFPAAKNPAERVQFLMPCLVRPDLPLAPQAIARSI